MFNSIKNNYYKDDELRNNILHYSFKPEFLISSNGSDIRTKGDKKTSSGFFETYDKDEIINRLVNSCKIKYKDLLIKVMFDEYIEDGYTSNSQELYSVISQECGDNVSSLLLNDIYLEYAQNNKIIKSILYVIGRLDPKDLSGIEVGIITFALNNIDYEVRDMALQCFEKWNSKRYLPLLKSLKLDVTFLQEYLNEIINQIECE